MAAYLHYFSYFHIQFVKELLAKYMRRGVFPDMPTDIVHYYSEINDKEIAVFLSLLMVGGRKGDMKKKVSKTVKAIGNRPWEWFRKRHFTNLSTGDLQDKKFGGTTLKNWQVARLLNDMWRAFFRGLNDDEGYNTLYDNLMFLANCKGITITDVLTDFLKPHIASNEKRETMVRLMLVATGTKKGIGHGLWKIPKEELLCPYIDGCREFVKMWYTDYVNKFGYDEIPELWELENHYDMMYIYMAWEELKLAKPVECRRYSTVFINRYKRRGVYYTAAWKGSRYDVIPKIKFPE